MDYLDKIESHIKALTPLLYVGTYSPEVIKEELEDMASSLKMDFHCVSLNNISAGGEDPLQTLDKIISLNKKNALSKRTLWILYFYHLFLKDPDPLMIAKFRQLADTKTLNTTSVILGVPHFKLPPELSDIFQIDNTAVPERKIVETITSGGSSCTGKEIEALSNNLVGIKSQNELETLLALSLVNNGSGHFDSDFILQERKLLIQSRSKGLFEVVEQQFGLEYLGGMEELIKWVGVRIPLLKMETLKRLNLTKPRGVLLIGVPGGGKSFFATAVGKTYNLPVVKLDPYRLFQSSLGETESNFLHVLESLRFFHTPVIFFIDEIEKSFSLTDGNSDGNTSNRILSSLLDFLSNHNEPIFTIATCNSIGALPPELLRKGRFDEIFYIPFPDRKERRAICKALCRKYGLNIPATDLLVSRLEGFTGSEIEQVFKDALYEALGRNTEGSITEFNLVKQAKNMVPIKLTMGEELNAVERWAVEKCRWASQRNQGF